MNNKFVVIDLETTGNSPKKGDKIIQFAAVVIENGEIVEKFSSFLNPGKKIPAFIEELTGINSKMVADAPCFKELAPKIQSLLGDAYFVAHNVLFDLSFLQEELIAANQEGFFGSVIDTVEMARFLFPTIDSFKLNDLAILFGFMHDRPHQADSDAEVTADLLLYFIKRIENLPSVTCKQLAELSGGLKSDIQLLFDEILENRELKHERMSDTLEVVNGIVIKKWIENFICDNNCVSDNYPNLVEEKETLLQSAFEKYEKRLGQFDMMDEVFHAFTNNQHLLIEAGTGVGKSLGYLLPAAYFAKLTNKQIVISTYTTQLQSQLVHKDLHLLKKLLPFNSNIVHIKGKSHYISLSRFERSLLEAEDNYDSCLTKMQILVWLLETETGDIDELNLSSGGQIFWNRIRHGDFPFTENELWNEKDFYLRAKNNISEANIIITNHALLLSNLLPSSNLLPPVDYIILDEGHHFAKISTQYFGAQLDYFKIRIVLNQFGLLEQKQLLSKLEKALTGKNHEISFGVINKLMADLYFEMDGFFKTIRLYAKNKSAQDHVGKLTIKISRTDYQFNIVHHAAERLSFLINDFLILLNSCTKILMPQSLDDNVQLIVDQANQACEELSVTREYIKRIFLTHQELDMAWIEIDLSNYQNATTVYLQPISVSEPLQKLFFEMKKSVIVTSATLTVENSFHYQIKELGLNPETTRVKSIPSPFDYKQNVKILVPNDLPDIKSVSIEDYVSAICEHIISIAEVTKGRMLVLFTSHDMLRKTYGLLKESGMLEEFVLLAQGVTSGSPSRLTKNFQRFEKAILFGTSSFWEGIDIPGEDLSCLIIVRLPFTPPDEPYIKAKCDEVLKSGGNAFTQVSLPEAVLRFKQGFGRLIRSENDKGVMIVFDRRILTTNYGHSFIHSIPNVPVKEKPLEDILNIIEKWLPRN